MILLANKLHKTYCNIHTFLLRRITSGPSGIFGSDGKQNTASAGARGRENCALSIISHEKTQ